MRRLIKCVLCLMILAVAASPVSASEIICTDYKDEVSQYSGTYYLNKETKHLYNKSKCVLRVYGGAKKVRWSSSNRKIATVKKKSRNSAVVKAKKAGICTITAKADDKVLSCVVQVTNSTRKAGTFRKGAFYIGKNKIYTLKKTLSSGAVCQDFSAYHYLYIVASRTQNTADSVIDPDVFFCSYSGCGISCMFERMVFPDEKKPAGLLLIDSFLRQQPCGTVLIDLGGNDVWNIKAYIGLYRTLIQRYPSATFRFISILPRESWSNQKREVFNSKLINALPSHVIDLYSFVLEHPRFETVDGTHYGPLLSRIVYENVMKLTGRNITVDLLTGVVSPADMSSDEAEGEETEKVEILQTEG